MSIVKFAQFATIEAKVAPARITRTAMLRDARRHQFAYEPKPGFLYIRSRAISSRTNDNFDTYPAEELRQAYRTFVGKPVFVNHNNEDPKRGRGIILDAVLHEHTAPDGSPDTWVEVLMEVDAVRFPRLAQAILDGDIDRTSMGCNVMSSECSYCGKVAVTPDQYCEHINNQKGRRLRRRAASGGVESVLVHEVCRGLSFFENSLLVDEPADPTAFFTGIDDSGMRMANKVAAFRPVVAAFRPVNLAGVHWIGGDGRERAFNAARPGFGVEDIDTGELVSSDGVNASVWSSRGIAAQIAEHAAVGPHRLVRKAAFDPTSSTGFVWSAYYDHWGGEGTPSHVSLDGPDTETPAEAAELAAQFPKSWGIYGGRVYSSDGEWGSVSSKNVVLMSNAANKGINETGLKRLRTVLAGLAARGFTPVYKPNASNAYPTEAAFWAAIENYEAGHVAAFKLAADDIDELVRLAQEAQAEWTRQQLKANRNSAAYKNAFARARETSKALLDAKLRRNKKEAIGVGDYGTPDERREVARENPGRVMFLDQHPDGRFNLQGRSVVRCTECDRLIEESGFASAAENAYFKHMSLDHHINIPLLPPGKGTKMAKTASYHHECVIWQQSKGGPWRLGFFLRIPGWNQDDEDYDSEWDDEFDTNRFEWASRPVTSSDAPEADRFDAPYPNPGSYTIYKYDEGDPRSIEAIKRFNEMAKGGRAAKVALGSEWDHGPTEPSPEAATRWEGVATSGQGYQVIVLWPEYADAMAAMLSGVFADPERAEEWAQKCRDLGAIDVSIRPPLMERGEEFLERHRWQGSKKAGRADQDYIIVGMDTGSPRIIGGPFDNGVPEEQAQADALLAANPGAQQVSSEWVSSMVGTAKRADYDEVHRAHPIETLRNQTCPVCKTQNSWDGNICTVCGYVLPPKPFRAPDTDVTGRVDPDEGWFDPDAKKAEPFDPVPDRDTATKGQKDQGVLTMAQSIAAAARQRLQAQQALAQQRRAGMPRRAADDTSWASPGVVEGGDGTITGDPVPPAEAPSETTEGAIALPDATNVDVETVGGTGVEDTAPDATADVTDVGGEVPAPAPMDVVNVEAPVAGATDLDPEAASDERPNVDNSAESADGTPLNASDWNTASRRAARSELENIRTAVRDRIFSALRLAKLRIAVGVAEHGDELALAREIENGRLSNESITNEIKALGLVYSRQRQAQSMPTAPHRRSARRSPSMAGGSTPLQSLGSGGHDDEALFEP